VIVPTRNRAPLLAAAIDSVLAQTLCDFELLVVDDASTDDTPRLLRARAAADARVRPLRLAARGGCNLARNLGIRHARGRYVAFLDDDDIALPGRLAAAARLLGREPGIDVVTSDYRFIDARGRLADHAPGPSAIGEDPMPGRRVFELLYCHWAWIPTSTLTVRAERLVECRYPPVRRPDGDSIFHSLLALDGACFYRLREPLVLIRRDGSYPSMSRDRGRLLAARRESLRWLRRALAARRISNLDHLHARAWSNQLLREAEHFGGPRGLARGVAALWHWPANPGARAYLRGRLAALARRGLRRVETG
jgi:glycosyltransferase involved in cell wall biosynthesis